MVKAQETPAKALRYSTSLYPVHQLLIHEIRLARGIATADIPGTADVIQDAIVNLARYELDPDLFARIVGAAEDEALVAALAS